MSKDNLKSNYWSLGSFRFEPSEAFFGKTDIGIRINLVKL